jgi:hypothetical protein
MSDSIFPASILRYINQNTPDPSEVDPSPRLETDQDLEEIPFDEHFLDDQPTLVEKAVRDRVPPTVATNLLHNRLLLIGLAALTAINTIGIMGQSFQSPPDLVFSEDGAAYKVRRISKNDQDERMRLEVFLAGRMPKLLTFSNLTPDKTDPTGRNFVMDEQRNVELKDGTSISIPYTNWKEQFIFAEGNRLSMLRWVAGLYKEVQADIQNRSGSSPYDSFDTYRFVFKHLDGVPKIRVRREVSPGVWEVIFTGEIIRYSKDLNKQFGNGASKQAIATFKNLSLIARVSRAPIVPPINPGDTDQDLIYYGKKDGYEIDILGPYNPQSEVLPAPQK